MSNSFYPENTLGSLVLGGYDINRFDNPAWNFQMGGVGRSLLQVSVTEMVVDFNDQSSKTANIASGQTKPFPAIIDSTLPFLYLPNSTCDTLSQMLGLNFDNKTGLYTLNSTQRTTNQNNIKDIRIIVSDTSTGDTSTTITLPYAAFDLQIGWPVYDNPELYFPIRRSQSDTNILGRAFLQEAYVIADYDRKNFSVATAAQHQAGVTQVVAIYALGVNVSGGKKLSVGAIAGIAVGAVAGVVILGLLAFFFYRKRQQKKKAEDKEIELQEQGPPTVEEGEMGREKRDRRQTVDTVTSGYSGATELDGTPGRPNASRHLSELSSDSGGDGHARVLNPPGIIYELDDPNTMYEAEEKTDTDAWQDNQSRFAADELAALRGETPRISPGLESVSPEPNRPSPFGPSRTEGATPGQSSVSPATATPSNQPSPDTQERTLHYPTNHGPSPPPPDAPSAP
jgi:Eukaryotic aspartyl protease